MTELNPIVNRTGSDSSSLDNMLEILVGGGMDLFRALRMLVPSACSGPCSNTFCSRPKQVSNDITIDTQDVNNHLKRMRPYREWLRENSIRHMAYLTRQYCHWRIITH